MSNINNNIDVSLVVCDYPAFRGQTLGEIATTDRGLLYLDWLVGHLESKKELGSFYQYLSKFLKIPSISRSVQEAMERDKKHPNHRGSDSAKPKPWWEKKK